MGGLIFSIDHPRQEGRAREQPEEERGRGGGSPPTATLYIQNGSCLPPQPLPTASVVVKPTSRHFAAATAPQSQPLRNASLSSNCVAQAPFLAGPVE